MTESEILIKVEAISSVMYEYLAYYKPIYMGTIEKQASVMPRQLRRKYLDDRKKDFQIIENISGRFSRLLSSSHSKEHSECIDLIHDALERIKINEV